MNMTNAIEAARALIAQWVLEFNTRDPARLLPLYADDATLLGTSEAKLFIGRDQIATYFKGRSTVELGEQILAPLSEDSVLSAGHYHFTRVQDGKPVVQPARFTFVVTRRHGDWRILHHHSSAQPHH
jgi:uncharacterized protein (TIGR02246 family)